LNKLKTEFTLFTNAVKTLGFKESFIFISVAIITFISMQYASPNFFRRVFDTSDDKFFSTIYWFSADGFLMFVIPLILIPLILKQKPSDFGFKLGDWKFGLTSSVVFIAIMLPVLWIASGSKGFARAFGIRLD